jgi:hypothetical protein
MVYTSQKDKESSRTVAESAGGVLSVAGIRQLHFVQSMDPEQSRNSTVVFISV